MLLAIDTATRMASLALYDEARGWILGEETWYSNDHHSVELMPRLAALLEQQGVAPVGLTGLVVSLGPGSFTGLRTGVSLAKGLVLARQIPLVGIPTLDVTMRPHAGQRLPIWAIVQAGRGRICAAHYVRQRGDARAWKPWRRQGSYLLTTVAGLCEHCQSQVAAGSQGTALFCGEIDQVEASIIRERLGDDALVVSPAAAVRRAAYLAEIGWERLARDDADDAVTLSPIYLHNPSIDGPAPPPAPDSGDD